MRKFSRRRVHVGLELERQYFLNGLKDGAWGNSTKVFCSGYDSFATPDIKGSVTEENLNLVVDVKAPFPISRKVYGDAVIVDFDEEITCPQLKSDDGIRRVTG